MIKRINYTSKNGNIAGLLQLPELKAGEKCPIAIVQHGIGDHKDTPFMQAVANGLYEKGIGSLRIDFNGHGESDGTFTKMTISSEVDDATAAIEYVGSLPYTQNISLVGHSQGGVVASLTAGKKGRGVLTSVVLLAPAVVLKDGANSGNILGGVFDTNNIPETLPIVWGVLGKNYIKDAQQLRIYEEASKYDGPVSLIHGTADAVVATHYSEELDQRLAHSELNLLSGYGHSFEPDSSLAISTAANFIKRQA